MMTHKIAQIKVSHHRLKLDKPFNASWDRRRRTHLDATIVRVISDSGIEGVGSGDRMLGFAGHEDLFIGQDPLRIERHFDVLSNLEFHYGRCWPLDLALWDLCGKIASQPVWKLLGGKHEHIRAYASTGVLRDSEAMAEQAVRLIELGFSAMKIRFHRADWRDDVKTVEAIRARVGTELELMVDCNQGWRMPWDLEPPWHLKDALRVARALESLDIYWMEEPLHRSDVKGMRQLRDQTSIRIAGAEMTRSLGELSHLIDARALDVIQPDAALVGGITGLRRVASQAAEAGVAFTPHTWTNGIGLAANAHLMMGIGNAPFIEYPFDPPEWTQNTRDFMLSSPVAVDEKGLLSIGDQPGLGCQLDESLLADTLLS